MTTHSIIVLKQVKYAENHLILSCLSYQKGLIKVIAYGAKKVGGKNFPVIGLFRHLHMELQPSKRPNDNLFIMKKAELITNYDAIASHYDNFQSACYLSQFTLKNLQEEVACPSLFQCFLLILTDYQQSVSIKMWQCIFLLNYIINFGYFHPQKADPNQKKLIEKIIEIEDNFKELTQLDVRVWDTLYDWLEKRCYFHNLIMPQKI